jgi:replicative DNA helicase
MQQYVDNKIVQLSNAEAERELIAGCLSDDNIWQSVSPLLSEELFDNPDNRKAYGIMRQMEAEGKRMDFTEFGMRLLSVNGDVGLYMSDYLGSYELTKQRAELLHGLMVRRKLYTLCLKGMGIATDPTSDVADFQKLMDGMHETTTATDTAEQSFGETLKELRKDISERIDGTSEAGMMTGLHIFDSHFGLHTGDLVIFAGRTSQGKSTLATTIARNMGLMGIPSAYYSLEMGAKQLTARIMARDTLLSSSRMLYDKMNNDELAKFDTQAERLEKLPIFYDDKSKTNFKRLCTSIRAMVRKHNIRMAFIDYLQILANGSNDNREQLIGDMARDLKRLAVELNICIIAISQLSRAKDKPEPTLMEMRGSGQIEEACDIAVLVYRPYVYGIERYKDGTLTFGTAQLTIAKGRNIGLAQEIVSFNGDLTYFYDRTDEQPKVQTQSSGWSDNSESLPF